VIGDDQRAQLGELFVRPEAEREQRLRGVERVFPRASQAL
jgi:hypothetical protein